MNKVNLLLSAFISSAIFLFGCSSGQCNCSDTDSSSSGVENPGSSSSTYSSSGVENSSSSGIVIQDQDLNRKSIKLLSGSSYADIDGEPTTYTKEEVANNLDKIDLIAYCGTDVGWCENNSIYSPYEIDLFWSRSDYIGSFIYLFEIPAAQSEIFKTATRLYEILPTYNNLVTTGILNGSGVDEIPIEAGKVFFVVASESNNFVIIKETDGQSVDLEIIQVPGR